MVQYSREMTLAETDPARGRRIAQLREARNLTQDQLAKQLGVYSTTVSRWERGGVIKPKNFDKLLRTLNAKADFVLVGAAEEAVVTYPAFDEYKAWLDKHPEESAALPKGALENIRTFRLTIGSDYEPTFSSYMTLHNFMVGLKRRKRSRD
jgi:transcriptional regulator with XRE-family HTH domain